MVLEEAQRMTASTPLMLQLKRSIPVPQVGYTYDESLNLNVAIRDGVPVPAVDCPEIRSRMKTSGLYED